MMSKQYDVPARSSIEQISIPHGSTRQINMDMDITVTRTHK